ncbi:hypothetical protein OXYTRIMIC_237 [Oxytricha trifallax]|uniref:Uncharacterized protein n=1 Tax=Oxytricha trifallax TaxID=1172189 RepID=A0A073HYX4_9SPIT|nr:hypothetical protein OXYTRIMIC_237 [Oxytricha trifallax]
MWQDIAQDCLQRYGRLYDVVMMDPAWRLKQELPYDTVSDQEFLTCQSILCKREEFSLFGWSTRNGSWPKSSLRSMVMRKSMKACG